MIEKFERIKLGHFPTPIEYLKNITEHLNGPQIYIKRDDCTGLATGGNKTRKLEFLMPDAIKNQADLVVLLGPFNLTMPVKLLPLVQYLDCNALSS